MDENQPVRKFIGSGEDVPFTGQASPPEELNKLIEEEANDYAFN